VILVTKKRSRRVEPGKTEEEKLDIKIGRRFAPSGKDLKKSAGTSWPLSIGDLGLICPEETV